MYRTHKRKFVSRVSAASVVAVAAAAGLAITLFGQSGAQNSAIANTAAKNPATTSATTSGASASPTSSPNYRLVSTVREDSRSENESSSD